MVKAIATHAVAETHDTAPISPDAVRATGITRQREPSHATGFRPPVSTQNRGDVHDTAAGFSTRARDVNLHRKPFHTPTTIAPDRWG